jgi:hypothetical protein
MCVMGRNTKVLTSFRFFQRRWPSLMRNALAFWRSEPTERLISLEIFFTRNLSFEYRLSSATWALVQGFVRRRRFAFLAIPLSNQ